MEVKDNIELHSDSNTNEAVTYATSVAGGGYYMPLHPSGRSWEVSREDVHVIKMIGKGAFSQVAQGRVKNLQANQEETTVAIKMLKGWLRRSSVESSVICSYSFFKPRNGKYELLALRVMCMNTMNKS